MLLLLLVPAALALPAGDVPFGPEQLVADGPLTPRVQVCFDLDGDGDRDVLYTSSEDDRLGWFENTDDSRHFSGPHDLPLVTRGPGVATAADLDGDGDLDVLASASGKDSGTGPAVCWFENLDGAGDFGPQQPIAVPPKTAVVLLTADLDGDGDEDVLHGALEFVWQANDGSGAFGLPQVVVPAGIYTFGAAMADMDLDGDPDLLVTRYSETPGLAWHANDGQGSFGAAHVIDAVAGCLSVDLLDLDFDGDPDLLASAGPSYPSKVVCHRNLDGAGTAWSQSTVWAGPSTGWVAAADLDGDGDEDAVSISSSEGARWFEHLDGAGSFGAGQLVPDTSWLGMNVSDLDGDGLSDLLGHGGAGVDWWPNSGGAFEEFRPITPPAYSPVELRAADIDGDGATDLVVVEASRTRITWFRNTGGSPGFGLPQTVAEDSGGGIRIVDLDADGDADVVTWLGPSPHEIVWYANDGHGSFAPKAQLVATPAYALLQCVDLDGDTDLDLLAAYFHTDEVVWYEHLDGAGSFGPARLIGTAYRPNHVMAADLDGDGDADVLYKHEAGDGLTVWQANTDGLGSFGPPEPVSTTAPGADPLDTADFDGDGDLDVLFGAPYEPLGWWRNGDGLGHFEGFQWVAPWTYGIRDARAADLDADGDLDVAAVRYLEHYIDGQPPEIYAGAAGWFENVGEGVFQGPHVAGFESTIFKPGTIVAADLDGDGDVDLATSSSGDHTIRWWENERAVWSDLGSGLAGSAGLPVLAGWGSLAPSSPFKLGLQGAPPLSLSLLVVGEQAGALPFKGGVLVPAPVLALVPLPTSALGSWNIISTWPTGLPPGAGLVLQCWIADAAAPAGWSASNALQASPP